MENPSGWTIISQHSKKRKTLEKGETFQWVLIRSFMNNSSIIDYWR